MLDTFYQIIERLGSAAYDPFAVLVEVALIALAVNWCLSVLQGTRGARLMRGLLVVLIGVTLVIRVLSVNLGLTRLEIVYQNFVLVLGLIALVAFQPELRRALIRAGEISWLRRKQVTELDRVIATLVESAGYLSRNKYGALIAIQRGVGLNDWIEHGTRLDANLTSGLLNSIFYPNSPLHDLGVIMQGDRVVAANCQFPSVESGEADTTLGSRHRAAIGMSQETDALVLVVSEETGAISLAEQGKLTRFLTLDTLEEELSRRLSDSWRGRTAPSGPTAASVMRSVTRAAIVVPLALIIWYFADQASLVKTPGLELAVTPLVDAGIHVDIIRPDPTTFSFTAVGSVRGIESIRSHDDEAIDWELPTALQRPGTHSVPAEAILRELDVIREAGVRVEGVSPDELQLTVDRVVTADFPVLPDPRVERVARAEFDPPTVRVHLRERDMQNLLQPQRVVYAQLEGVLERRVPARGGVVAITGAPVALPSGDVRPLAIDPPSVAARVTLTERLEKRQIEGVRVQASVNPDVLRTFDLSPLDESEWLLDLEIEGPPATIAPLTADDIQAYAVLTDPGVAPAGDILTAPVRIITPPRITVLGPPRTVRYQAAPRPQTQPADQTQPAEEPHPVEQAQSPPTQPAPSSEPHE